MREKEGRRESGARLLITGPTALSGVIAGLWLGEEIGERRGRYWILALSASYFDTEFSFAYFSETNSRTGKMYPI